MGGDSSAGASVPNCCSVLQIASRRCPLAVDPSVLSSCRFSFSQVSSEAFNSR